MNTYSKYVPNVFLAKCSEKHEKGEVIEVTTKYGKENECIVFNLIYEREGFYYYSIVRADGFNVQEWAKQRAERRHDWAQSAGQKSNEYFNRSNKDKDFLWMQYRIWWGTEYAYLPGLHRYAGVASGIE